jgi:hypothetical protein
MRKLHQFIHTPSGSGSMATALGGRKLCRRHLSVRNGTSKPFVWMLK